MSHLYYLLDIISINKNDIKKNNTKKEMLKSVMVILFISTSPTYAENYFNPRFLADDPESIADLSGFEKGLEAPPGSYRVDIYMNDGYMTTRDVIFNKSDDGKKLEPCLTRSQLSVLGVNTLILPNIAVVKSTTCIAFSQLITGASSTFDVGRQRLYISIPQAFMGNHARGYIAPEFWDNGITAGLLNYNYTGSELWRKNGEARNYSYFNLQSGINFGAWRLRDNATWSNSNDSGNSRWQHINTWLERNIASWRSRLTVGDDYTAGDIFDGISFRGVQVVSDDNMLPDSQRGFAPVIHGIARGTASVSIKQNGYVVYQTTVPPGAFTIDDLYATGNSGDLMVTVKEADGATQVFSVPFSSVPMLQREGQVKYSVTAGQYRSGNRQQDKPKFIQGAAFWGLNEGWTVYGGTRVSNDYNAFNLGLGKNLGYLGAVSADITQANTTLPDNSKHQGQSLRFLYNKSLNELGTNFQLVGYRYSTQGFYSLADTTWHRMNGSSVPSEDGSINVTPQPADYYNLNYKKRGRLQTTITQQVGRTSTVYLTGSHQSYWNTGRTDKQLQISYNSTIQDISWNLSYSLSQNAWSEGKDRLLSFNINIPFSHWMRSDTRSEFRNANASYNTSTDLKGHTTNMAGLYGTLLEDDNLSYSVQTGYASGRNGNRSTAGNTALNYRGTYGSTNIGYSHNVEYKQLYYGASGGVLIHENGVTLGQAFSDTMILIEAPGAKHVSVENQTGVQTDWRGYAVLPYAMDYHENRISLNTDTLANNVELEEPVLSVVPTHGAVVRAAFKARVGLKVLMTLTNKGKPVPFGSIASYGDGQSGSIVADGGQVYLTGLLPKGSITVKWGNGANENCTANYSLPADNQKQALSYASAICR
ncbi:MULTISPECIES: fimbrial biogenesis usher protein [unclassified Serratia (in: enterobacteria)]|uniref:fimbrial biogenesis usher protein n=1 Tax=unclassified Serratia (in: enterobacteria) TaxID=2647522 RepID=UPI0027F52B6C|nr:MULTISPECIES: fimbrial biogenesis usher protein [unclassified Serratia (in: enterobacteria)]MDQ7099072.1 fimbrial biogenesis usher protein [Serratia sp. MF2]MDQ7105578.1 fimbrial biogenesis usher protein [Serratia sp. MF1(2023)]